MPGTWNLTSHCLHCRAGFAGGENLSTKALQIYGMCVAGEHGWAGATRERWCCAPVLSTLQVQWTCMVRFLNPFQLQWTRLIMISPSNLILISLLLALNNPKVNYFSLDIEGAELQVLRSVPWHLVDIEVWSVLIS